MLRKTIKRILLVVCGAVLLGFIVGLVAIVKKERKVNQNLQDQIHILTSDKAQLENQISTLNQTVDNLKGMEFKFIYPTGMTLDVVPEIKEGENGYYAEIMVNGVSANASMATNFSINGSQYSLNLKDFDLLARTVRAESGGMSEEANIATANVIFHRVESDLYPDNISDVIHQPHQFEVVSMGTYLQQPTEKAVSATVKAMNGVDMVPTALGFWDADAVPAGHELWNYPIIYRIGSHVFSRLDG